MIANSVAKGIIIDEAFTRQKPVSMSKSMILLVAVFMGMMIPPCLLYARRLFRTKFSSREELEPLTELPVIGEVCTDKSGETLVVTPSSTTSTAELFRLIRANLQFVLNGKDDKVVLMTSTSSERENRSYPSTWLHHWPCSEACAACRDGYTQSASCRISWPAPVYRAYAIPGERFAEPG